MSNETETLSETDSQTTSGAEVTQPETSTKTSEAEPDGLLTKDNKKAEEAKGSDSETETAPEPLTIEALGEMVPEGFEIEPETLETTVATFNELGVTSKQAKALLNLYADQQTKAAEATAEVWQQHQEQQQKAIKEHPQFGGVNYEQNLAVANELVRTYGDEAFTQELNLTGLSNSPNFFAFLMKLSEELPREGKPTDGRPATTPPDPADVLFGSVGVNK